MGKEESPQVNKRSTRLSFSKANGNNVVEQPNKSALRSSSISDLVYGEQPFGLDTLLITFAGRREQILELLRLLGPLNSPMFPLLVYGGPSSGKTGVILQMFRHLARPFVYTSCRTCYSPRVLFESVLNQLLLHRRDASNGYSSAKRCEKPSDFINLLREALTAIINCIEENGRTSKGKMKSSKQVNGNMIYLIFDNVELVREWDKSSSILPFLFSLTDILNMPQVGFIFISNNSLDMFYSNMGSLEPVSVYFPSYTEDDLRQIFMKSQGNKKLYSPFLDVVLKPFCRTTRRLDELSPVFSSLFRQYCNPISGHEIIQNEDVKRKLYSNLKPYISSSLNKIFTIQCQHSSGDQTNELSEYRGNKRKVGSIEDSDGLDFHMSTSAKYLLISAFLASRNPATLDASLFDPTGGSDSRKKRRKVTGDFTIPDNCIAVFTSTVLLFSHQYNPVGPHVSSAISSTNNRNHHFMLSCYEPKPSIFNCVDRPSEKSKGQKEMAEEELLGKGPGSFPLERLLAIFQCITSVADGFSDDDMQANGSSEMQVGTNILMSDVLLQLSSLCNANFIIRGSSCPLEGSTRYRSMLSEDLALKVARSLKFPLAKYMYKR